MMGIQSPASIPFDTGGKAMLTEITAHVQRYGSLHSKAAYTFNIIGRRSGFTSTSAMNDIKEFDFGIANFPQLIGNEALELVSSSALDITGGVGARMVKITYIDSANAMVESAAIILNGTTPVLAGFVANEILWVEVVSAGSAGAANGNILLRTVVGQVGLEQITAGGDKSLSARFMVPAGFTGHLINWNAYAINNDQDVRLQAQVNSFDRSLSSLYHFQDNIYLSLNSNAFGVPLPFLRLPSLCRVKASTISGGSASNVRCDVSFTILLIQN